MKKYELTTDTKIYLGRKLFRIKALIDFGNVKKGDLGGYIEKEDNLSHDGDAWVYGDAEVYGKARVCGDAEVCGDARVYGDAEVYGKARVCGDAEVCGDAKICDTADYLCFKGLGPCNRNTTFYKTKNNGVFVVCGYFSGTLDEFIAEVRNKHGDSKYAKEYLATVDVVKIHFEVEDHN